MKRKIRYLLPALLFLLGAAILLYPPLSSFWNQRRQNTQIAAYRQTVAALDAADRATQRAAAQAYNDGLPRDFHDAFTGRQPPEDDLYWSLLDPNGTGVMGYLGDPEDRCAAFHWLRNGRGHPAVRHRTPGGDVASNRRGGDPLHTYRPQRITLRQAADRPGPDAVQRLLFPLCAGGKVYL